MLRKIYNYLRAAVRLGDDVFISYAHGPAGEYAAALRARLGKRYEVYYDGLHSEPGNEISKIVIRHLRRASLLVVVISDAATRSDTKIRDEVREFLELKRPIIVINVKGAFEQCQWQEELLGLSRIEETADAFDSRRPSVSVRRSIEHAFVYLTRAQRLAVIATTILTVTGSVVAWSAANVKMQSLEASAAARFAEVERMSAKMYGLKAAAARQFADQQGALATARQRHSSALQITDTAAGIWSRNASRGDLVLLLAAESLRRSPTPAAMQLISDVRALQPVSAGSFARPHVEDGELGLDGHTLVMKVEKTRGDDDHYKIGVRLLDIRTGHSAFVRIACSDFGFADFSPHGEAVSFSCNGQATRPPATIVDLRTSRVTTAIAAWPLHVEGGAIADAVRVNDHDVELHDRATQALIGNRMHFDGYVTHTRFSADGQVVAVAVARGNPGGGGADVWFYEVRTGGNLGHLSLGDTVSNLIVNRDGTAAAILSNFDSLVLSYAERDEQGDFATRWIRPVHAPGYMEFIGDAIAILDAGVVRIVGGGAASEESSEIRRIVESSEIRWAKVLGDDIVTCTRGRITRWHVGKVPAGTGRPLSLDPTGRFLALTSRQSLMIRDAERDIDVFRHQFPPAWKQSPTGENGSRIDMVALDAGARHAAVDFPVRVLRYDLRRGTLLPERERDSRYPQALALDDAGDRLVVGAAFTDGIKYWLPRVTVRNAADHIIDSFPLHQPSPSVAVSSDGSCIVAADGTCVWLRRPHRNEVLPIAADLVGISSDGNVLVTARRTGAVELRDAANRHAVFQSFDVGENVAAFSLSDDKSLLAIAVSAKASPRLLIFRVATKERLLELPYPNGMQHFGFRRGTHILTTVDDSGNVRALDPDPLRTAVDACHAAGRSLTQSEWSAYIGSDTFVDTCAEVAKSLRSSPAVR